MADSAYTYHAKVKFTNSKFTPLTSVADSAYAYHAKVKFTMKKVNKQCLLDTPRTVRVSEKLSFGK